MDGVICDKCGLPTLEPKVSTDGSAFLCEECRMVCPSCEGEGTVSGKTCLNCSGSGKDPLLDPEADIFG